jgi:hypothetical protein
MESAPHLKIYLAETMKVKLESATPFLGRPLDLSFELDEVKGGPSGPPVLGKAIHAILSEWHTKELEPVGPRALQIAPIFGDLDVVERLIVKSRQQKTRAYVEAINHLIAEHDEDEHSQLWEALAQDWPLLQKSIP